MTAEQLEQRLAAIERALTDLHQRLDEVPGAPPRKHWWEGLGPTTADQVKAWDEMAPYMKYIRQTGQSPPPDWKPGDPIPEPDWWGPDPDAGEDGPA